MYLGRQRYLIQITRWMTNTDTIMVWGGGGGPFFICEDYYFYRGLIDWVGWTQSKST